MAVKKNVITIYSISKRTTYELKMCSMGVSKFDFVDLDILSDTELAYFYRCVTKKRKVEFFYGRLVAKLAVNEYLNYESLKKISIEKGIFNYPVIKNKNNAINVSISHSEDKVIAIAFPEELMVGIDIERIRKKNINAVTMFEKEKINIDENSKKFSLTQEKYATLIWSSKEAIAKALKIGFTAHPDIYEVNNISVNEKWYEISFKSFSNFTAYNFIIGEFIISIACPKELIINWEKITFYLQ